MSENENFIIQRIPLDAPGLCAHALVISGAQAFRIGHVCQKDMHAHVKDPVWGTEPSEITKMAQMILLDSHICVKEDWTFTEFTELFDRGRVVVTLDVTDTLSRFDKVLQKEVGKDKIDGHYVILKGIHNEMALISDPSADEIVHEDNTSGEGLGVITTKDENIYYLPLHSLDKMWWDTYKNGKKNNHWAIVMLHPDDDPMILDKYRVK